MSRAADLIAALGLRPHPEGGHYGEVFRSSLQVHLEAPPDDPRPLRSALTTIDFLLTTGQFSAWHRVRSDETWHLLEGAPLTLWLAPPDLSRIESVELGTVDATRRPRHAVPADWWQAAESTGDFSYVGATVGPGFTFEDFSFGRDDAVLTAAIERIDPALLRLL